MKTLFNKIAKVFNQFCINANLNRTARELLMSSDSRLLDIGVARHLLLQGAKAYPWREMNLSSINTVAVSNTRTVSAKVSVPAKVSVLSAA
jgi:hypothetical protein